MVELVDLYRDRVFRFCYRMLGQHQDAEDAAQETFVRVFRSLAGWDCDREFEPWLLAIAGNRCRTLLAARKRVPTAGLVAEEQLIDRRPDGALLRSLREEVQLALLRLRPEHREAFVMFHENGLSYDQIAAAIRCPLGTVKTWIYKARQQLMAQLRQRDVVGVR
jgi:RNA polymerase sigma-70 factor, ECF subfamily